MEEKEIAHYSNQKLWEKLKLSESNKERIEKTVDMIPPEVNSIADVGCGSGLFLNYIKENLEISKLMGVDFSISAMKTLRTSKKVGDISKIPLKDDSYDLVSVLEVLEHLDATVYEKAKKELVRVSRKYILVSVPFSEDLGLENIKCPQCKNKFNKSHHKRTFKESVMRGLFQDEGYRCKEIEYISKRHIYFLVTPLMNGWRKLRGYKDLSDTVCPFCGYTEKDSAQENSNKGKKQSFSKLAFLKNVWPKKHTYKWIACLYKKLD